ncbi:MAG: IS110 family transposase [Terracidiphilus sp.]
MVALELDCIDQLSVKLLPLEQHIDRTLASSPEIQLLQTLPGAGETLAPVLWLEIADVERFPRAENLASYAGLVPRVISSGGRTHHGGVCRNINRYLKWAFVEAANCAAHRARIAKAILDCSINVSRPTRATVAPSSPSPGRGKLLDAAQARTLQAPAHPQPFVQVRASARHS